jgi:transcription antitermination factor NusG
MDKQWFVLHTLTGQENKALKSIEARVKLERMEDYIGRCVIPTERVTEKKNGKKRTIVKKFFPGYVLCELALYDSARGVDENGKKIIYDRTWQFLRETPGVIGFVGSDRPQPLKQSEVDAILLDKPSGAAQAERPDAAADAFRGVSFSAQTKATPSRKPNPPNTKNTMRQPPKALSTYATSAPENIRPT